MPAADDPPLEFDGPLGSVIAFALTSTLTPALLLDGAGEIEAASPAALADLGVAPDEINSRSVEDLLGIRFEDLSPAGASPHLLTSPTVDDGAEPTLIRWRSTSLTGARLDGGWLVEFRLDDADADVSLGARSARLEELLDELSDRYERLNRYVSLISHDLQAPARRLLSFVELARNDHADGEPIEADLDAIERSARYLVRLTTELLQFSRLGHEPMPIGPTATGEILAETLEQLDGTLLQAGATVTVRPDLPTVVASPTFLAIVFQHLIQNAIRYRRDEDPRVEIDWQATDEAVRIDVTDNGTGIAPEHHAAVFQPFRRLVAGDLEHTGLGLATVHDIMERFGGSITVAMSTPGVGSTFALTFRRHRGE